MVIPMEAACHAFVENYLKGRNICSKNPVQRSQEDLVSLKQWLLEKSIIFKVVTEAGFQRICKHASLKVIKQDQLIYQQEDIVDCFYIILRGSVSLMFDPQFHAKVAAKLNQMLTDPNDQKSLLGKMVTCRKAPTKASLGVEVDSLRPGNYFGQEGILQKDEVTSVSAVANEYTELLVIDIFTFKDVFLAHFERDLYDKAFYLVNLNLFSNWTPHHLRQLALSVKEVRHGNSQCLYRQGMLVSHVLVIKSGSVKLSMRSNSKPTQELLDQIIPPKDYLSDILAEVSISTKKPLYKSLSVDTSRSRLFSASPSVISNAIHLRSRALLKHTVSAPRIKKRKILPKAPEISNPIVGFRLQEPRPQSTCQVCCLGPGDMFNHIEMLCNIKHSLFNAYSLSDVTIYAIDMFTFMQLLEKKPLHSLHSLIHQTSERVQVWKGRHPSIQIFKPLSDILQQSEKRIPSNFYSRKSKPFGAHSPEKLAYLTVKHLGKSNSCKSDDETPRRDVDLRDGPPPLSEALIRKQFFIRQLTGESLDNSYVYVSKTHTSFDAPLPKTYKDCAYSSDNSEETSPLLRRLSTDEETETAAPFPKEKPLLARCSIISSLNQSATPTNVIKKCCKELSECDKPQPKSERFSMPKKLKPSVDGQDLSNRLSIKNFCFTGNAIHEDRFDPLQKDDTNTISLTTNSNKSCAAGYRDLRIKEHKPFSR